jgi:hypothetical protein
MGAEFFCQKGYGSSPDKAFASAQSEACHEYGHGGYTGTLAEKEGYVLIKPTAAEYKAALAYKIDPLKAKIAVLRKAIEELTAAKAAGQTFAYTRDHYGSEGETAVTQIPVFTDQLAKAEETLANYSKPDFKVSASTLVDYYNEKRDHRIDDKWGPAGCLVIREPVVSNLKRVGEERLIAVLQERHGADLTVTIKKVGASYQVIGTKKVNDTYSYGGYGSPRLREQPVISLKVKTLSEIVNSYLSKQGEYLFFGWASS